MNYIANVLDILQNRTRTTHPSASITAPIYTERYMILITETGLSSRRILIRTPNGERNEMLDIIVGSGVSNKNQFLGLSHHTLNSDIYGKNCHSWYQMRVPYESNSTINYLDSNNFVENFVCEVDLNSEEDVFQKSMIVPIDMDMVQSLVLEMSQLRPYLAMSENLLVLCTGYDQIDFNQIFEALNG